MTYYIHDEYDEWHLHNERHEAVALGSLWGEMDRLDRHLQRQALLAAELKADR